MPSKHEARLREYSELLTTEAVTLDAELKKPAASIDRDALFMRLQEVNTRKRQIDQYVGSSDLKRKMLETPRMLDMPPNPAALSTEQKWKMMALSVMECHIGKYQPDKMLTVIRDYTMQYIYEKQKLAEESGLKHDTHNDLAEFGNLFRENLLGLKKTRVNDHEIAEAHEIIWSRKLADDFKEALSDHRILHLDYNLTVDQSDLYRKINISEKQSVAVVSSVANIFVQTISRAISIISLIDPDLKQVRDNGHYQLKAEEMEENLDFIARFVVDVIAVESETADKDVVVQSPNV